MQLGASRFVVVAAQLKERLDRDHLRPRGACGRRDHAFGGGRSLRSLRSLFCSLFIGRHVRRPGLHLPARLRLRCLNPRLNRWPMDLVLRATRRARLIRRARRPRKQRLAIQASRSRRPRGRGRRERRTPQRLLVMGPRPPLRKTRVAVAPRVAAEVRHLSLRHHLSPERQPCPHRRLQRMRRDNM